MAGILYLAGWSLPFLECLNLENIGIDADACAYLGLGRWPELQDLHVVGNNIGTKGVSYLVQGDWPLLTTLNLSSQGLDEEAYTLMGIAPSGWFAADFKLEDRGGAITYTYKSSLREKLQVQLTCPMVDE